jgi:glycosyltransferase involved in cell wall biosynthesis
MRICLVYDCLYPNTVGGAERWYRQLGERLAREGHEVTYLTLRQWPRGERTEVPGVRVLSAGPRLALYTKDGRRRVLPPLVFGMGVLAHLARNGAQYDVVHTASFPYFSLLSAAAARSLGRYEVMADWHEVWTRDYWRDYLGTVGGWIGWRVQRRCARLRQRAFCFSRLHAARLREEGLRGTVTVLEGEYVGRTEPAPPRPAEPLVVFAGRHIPEKRAPSLVPAIALARQRHPELRGLILGDGPDRPEVLRRIAELGLQGSVGAPGFVSGEELEEALARALCMVLPSRREGYGLVVVEAASLAVPSVVVSGPDNAAMELVEDGVNGAVARSAEPDDLAEAILRVHSAGPALRTSTAKWFAANARRLSLESSLETVLSAYSASVRS